MFSRLQTFARSYVQETPTVIKEYFSFGYQAMMVLWVLDDEIEEMGKKFRNYTSREKIIHGGLAAPFRILAVPYLGYAIVKKFIP